MRSDLRVARDGLAQQRLAGEFEHGHRVLERDVREVLERKSAQGWPPSTSPMNAHTGTRVPEKQGSPPSRSELDESRVEPAAEVTCMRATCASEVRE